MLRMTTVRGVRGRLRLDLRSPPALAQENVRLRATIEKVDGPVYTVKNRDGAEWKLTVSDRPLFVAIAPATMADIKPGMFVGSAGMMQDDGTQKAIEVHIFPELMRGTGKGITTGICCRRAR